MGVRYLLKLYTGNGDLSLWFDPSLRPAQSNPKGAMTKAADIVRAIKRGLNKKGE